MAFIANEEPSLKKRERRLAMVIGLLVMALVIAAAVVISRRQASGSKGAEQVERRSGGGSSEILLPPEALEAGRLIQSFQKEPDWRKKKLFIWQPDRVSGRMHKFYAKASGRDAPDQQIVFEGFDLSFGVPLLVFLCEDRTRQRVTSAYVVRGEDGQFKLDWESYVGAGEMEWEEFLHKRLSVPILLRGLISLGEAAPAEDGEESGWQAFRFESPDARHSVGIRAIRGSDASERLLQALKRKRGRPAAVTLSVSFSVGATTEDVANLDEVLADRWFYVDDPAQRLKRSPRLNEPVGGTLKIVPPDGGVVRSL